MLWMQLMRRDSLPCQSTELGAYAEILQPRDSSSLFTSYSINSHTNYTAASKLFHFHIDKQLVLINKQATHCTLH